MKNSSLSTELYQFFANFHQDWDIEADDWQGIVDNYFNADPAVEPARTLAHEIDDMCTRVLNPIWSSPCCEKLVSATTRDRRLHSESGSRRSPRDCAGMPTK